MTTERPTEPFHTFLLLLQRWLTLCIFALLGLGIGGAYALLATPWYAATLTVVPSQRSVESGGVGLPFGPDASANDAQRIKAVFASRSVEDAVIEQLGLDAHYGTAHRQLTRAILGRRCGVSIDRLSAVVALTCEDPSAELATKLAAVFGEEGNRVFRRISASSASEERKFLETQVEKARQGVEEASRKLRDFQRAHKVIDLSEQSRAVISAMAAIKGEALSKQLELAYLAGFSADGESSVVQLRRQLGILQGKLRQLETARSAPAATAPAPQTAPPEADFFPPAMSVPDLRFELEELVREQKMQETLFFVLTQRYETAKVNEARDTSTFQILDAPVQPTYPARPDKRSIAILGLCGGLVLAFAWIILPVAWRNRIGRAASA